MKTTLPEDKKFGQKFTHKDANAVKAAITELDGNISNINSLNLWIPKNAVATKSALVTTYPTPAKNWAAMVLADGYVYINDGLGALEENWVNSGQKQFPVDVALKSEVVASKIIPGKFIYESTHEPYSNDTMCYMEISYTSGDIIVAENTINDNTNYFAFNYYNNNTYLGHSSSFISENVPTNTNVIKINGQWGRTDNLNLWVTKNGIAIDALSGVYKKQSEFTTSILATDAKIAPVNKLFTGNLLYEATHQPYPNSSFCFAETSYAIGDVILAYNTRHDGSNFWAYNFFNGSTYIGHSADLSNIPSSTTIIKINGRWNDGVGENLWVTKNGIPIDALSELHSRLNRPLTGKTIWALGDSLSAATYSWLDKFVEKSGALCHRDVINNPSKPISYGGTMTSPDQDDGGQARALNLASYIGTYPIDYIFIQNINDLGYFNSITGQPTDKAFMRSNVTILQGLSLTSGSASQAYWEGNYASILENIGNDKRVHGAMVRVPFTSSGQRCGSRILFNSLPTSNGTAYVIIGTNRYGIQVTTSDTIATIINKILLYSYGNGWTDTDNGDNSVSIFNYMPTDLVVTFDPNGTGITTTITDTGGSGSYTMYYYGNDSIGWSDLNNWKYYVSFYSAYKGLFGYLQKVFPAAKVILMTMPRYAIDLNSSSYKNADGTWNQDQYKIDNSLTFENEQKTLCAEFNIPVIDVMSLCGIGLNNLSTFYFSNDPHPKVPGWDRLGETIFENMPK